MKNVEDLGPGDTVMALSLHQPWASLMAGGEKTIETRPWATAYRGPLLICAAKRKRGELVELVAWSREIRRAFGLAVYWPAADLGAYWPSRAANRQEVDALPFGQAVALVDLFECSSPLPVEGWEPPAPELPFGDFSPGRHAWRTRDLRRIKPFPVTGRPRLFRVTLPADLEDWKP